MKKVFIHRIGISLLLIGSLYTTTSSITNITLTDLHVWKEQQVIQTNALAANMAEKQVILTKKTLVTNQENHLVVSSERQLETLEETIKLEQYPRDLVVATGYTAGVESTGKTTDHPEYGITFSGIEVKRDLYSTIAADLSVYPIGTIMYIPDYGYGVVADKGSAITGNKIDLYYPTVDDVYEQWGKREVEVYIIQRGDGKLTEDDLVKWNEEVSLQVFRDQIKAEP